MARLLASQATNERSVLKCRSANVIVEPEEMITAGGIGDPGEVEHMTAEGCKSCHSDQCLLCMRLKAADLENLGRGSKVVGVLDLLCVEKGELPEL